MPPEQLVERSLCLHIVLCPHCQNPVEPLVIVTGDRHGPMRGELGALPVHPTLCGRCGGVVLQRRGRRHAHYGINGRIGLAFAAP